MNNEFESLRKTNKDLSKVLMVGECELWNGIKDGKYSWLNIKSDKKKKLFRLIDIYPKSKGSIIFTITFFLQSTLV